VGKGEERKKNAEEKNARKKKKNVGGLLKKRGRKRSIRYKTLNETGGKKLAHRKGGKNLLLKPLESAIARADVRESKKRK